MHKTAKEEEEKKEKEKEKKDMEKKEEWGRAQDPSPNAELKTLFFPSCSKRQEEEEEEDEEGEAEKEEEPEDLAREEGGGSSKLTMQAKTFSLSRLTIMKAGGSSYGNKQLMIF